MEDSKASPSSVARAQGGAAAPTPKKNRAELIARVQWGIGLLITGALMAMWGQGWTQRAELPLLDWFTSSFHSAATPPSDSLAMIIIDDPALQTVGRWPWSRQRLAQMIDELRRAGADTVALDLYLDDPELPHLVENRWDPSKHRIVDGDRLFADAIKAHGRVVLGATFPFVGDEEEEEATGRRIKRVSFQKAWDAIQRDLHTDGAELKQFLDSDERQADTSVGLDDLKTKLAWAKLLHNRLGSFSVQAPDAMKGWPESNAPRPATPVLLESCFGLGSVSAKGTDDIDGVMRRMPLWVQYRDRLFPTLGLASVAAFLRVPISEIQVGDQATVLPARNGGVRLETHTADLLKLPDTNGLVFMAWPNGEGYMHQFSPARSAIVGGKPAIATPSEDAPSSVKFPPGEEVPIGKVLDPVLAAEKITRNITDLNIALRAANAKLPFIDDQAKFFERSAALERTSPDDPGWRSLYDEHAARWLKYQKEAASFAEDLAKENSPSASDQDNLANMRGVVATIDSVMREVDSAQRNIADLRAGLRQRLSGKLCLMGWIATASISDFVKTSIAVKTPGPYLHAVVANSLLTGYQKLVSAPSVRFTNYAAILVMGVIGTLIAVRMDVTISPIALLLSLGAWVAIAALVLFDRRNMLVASSTPMISASASWLGITLHRLLFEQRSRKQTEARFRSYVSPDVVDILVNNPELQSMAPTRRELTIMFSDVANWTTLTERLGTEGIYKFLSKYLGEMTDIIQRNKATLDKYLGDGIMAFWGAPIEDPDHAKNAAIACVEMVKRLDEMNRKGEFGDAGTVEVRFGIATGEVNVGDFGNPPHKSAYTVIGDAVNLSARLESSNKQFGTSILMTKRVVDLSRAEVLFRPIGRIVVKGKTEYEELYELIGDRQPKGERTRAWIDLTNQAIAAYQKGDLDAAEAAFHRMADDFDDGKLAKLYLHAIDDLRKSGIPEGWEGTLVLTEK